MAAVRGGVSSCGHTNTRRAGHLLPLPCKTEPSAGSCVSPGSSWPRSKASRAAACYAADVEPKPEVEASVGKNKKTLLAVSAMEGRGGRYDSRRAPSDCAGSLNHHRSASPSPCTRRGDGYRDPRGGEDASSSVTRRLEKRQGRLPTRADFMKPSSRHENNSQTDTMLSCIPSGSNHSVISMNPSATPRNIRVHTTRHGSLLDRRVEGANQEPPRSIHKAAPARLMDQDCILSSKCFEQSSSSVSHSSNSSGVHLEKDEATSTSGGIWDWEDKYHMTTLGPGGGYGRMGILTLHPSTNARCAERGLLSTESSAVCS